MTEQHLSNQRLRELAHGLDCYTEEDYQLLSGYTDGTIEAYRKRGVSPPFVRLGRTVLYPRKDLIKFLESRVKAPVSFPVGDLL